VSSWRRLPAAVLVAAFVSAGSGGAAAAPPSAGPAPLGYTTYGAPTQVCRPTDRRLDSVSGIAVTSDGIHVQNDREGTLWRLDDECRPVRQLPVPDEVGRLVDTEDLAATADGSLWIADIGGNRVQRTVVSLVQMNVNTGELRRYALRYPDGPHDADALLISPNGSQVLIVTKSATGTATVFAAVAPLRTTAPTPLQPVAAVRMGSLMGRNPGRGAVLVTGGAVSPDGMHLVLRTYNEAWEWDAGDGRLADAFQGLPRKVVLPETRQGEAITYTSDGGAFLVSGEQLAPIFRVAIDRPSYAPAEAADTPAARHDRDLIGLVLAAGAIGCLLLLVGALRAERRRSRRPSAELAEDVQRAEALRSEPN
jgi:hypothetical protein